MRFTTWSLVCTKCEKRFKSLQWDYEPFVCECGGHAVTETPLHSHGVVPDSIPGGLLVPHAICNADGTPKRYYSRTDIDRALAEKGYCRLGETPKRKNTWV